MKRPRTFHRNGKVSPICPNLGLCILDVIKLPSLLTPLLADRVQFQPRGYVHPAGVNFCPPTVSAGSGARQSGCAYWESNRTLPRISVVHATAAIAGKDAKRAAVPGRHLP